jgi:predicted DNA-binding transcriptional regulator AlpA
MERNSVVIGAGVSGTAAPADDEMGVAVTATYVGEGVRGQAYTVKTIYNLRSTGDFPAPDVTRRNRPFWRRSTLDRWIGQQVKIGAE